MGKLRTLALGGLLLPFVGCDLEQTPEVLLVSDAAASPGPTEPPPGADAEIGPHQHSADLPCAVEKLLAKHCRSCHGQILAPSVPFPLISFADLTAQAAGGASVIERVKARIHDERSPMPPLSANDPLAPEALKTLDDWIGMGAPASTDTCPQAEPPPAAEIDTSECEYLPVMLAHGGQEVDDEQGFEVPLVDTHFECFNFAIPWNEPMQALALYPQIGDRRVLHHMGLYAAEAGTRPGTHAPCGEGTDRTLLAGWSPGQDRIEWPSEYGLLMPNSASGVFQLEVHYDNVGRYQARDRSGLKVCATTKFRPKTLAAHATGSNDITLQPGRGEVSNSCLVTSEKGPATVIATSPHMHGRGVHMLTVVKHPDGTQETITDQPFTFANQALNILSKPVIVKKGDVLTTTCSYDNDTGRVLHYSRGSDGEMCANGLIAHPPGSISGGLLGDVVGALGVPNICMGIGPEPIFGL